VSEQEMEAPVALFRHTVAVYEEMASQGKIVTVDADSNMLVYEGKLVELVTETCGLSVPYYTKVTQALKGMGCARQLRRGGGNSLSQWELIREPTLELFEEYAGEPAEVEPELPDFVTMQQFQDLNNRMSALERAVGL
jgi:hypothetical protein